jgi:hypothetical protein
VIPRTRKGGKLFWKFRAVSVSYGSACQTKGPTMQQVKWLMTVCVSLAAGLVFSAAICGVLIVSLTTEFHQQLWHPK